MRMRPTFTSSCIALTLFAGISIACAANKFEPAQDKIPTPAPEGATVLFDGTEDHLFLGKEGDDVDWPLEDGTLISSCAKRRVNHIVSKLHFRDAHIHVEFMTPEGKVGNSGIYIHGNYELQIINSWGKEKISNHDMGAIYGFHNPLVNAARKPGEWQVYDIKYTAPRRNKKGEITKEGSITAWLNGQLVQDNSQFGEPRSVYHPFRYNTTDYLRAIWEKQKKTSAGPVFLQDHGNPVKFRNVWVKPLDDQSYIYEAEQAE